MGRCFCSVCLFVPLCSIFHWVSVSCSLNKCINYSKLALSLDLDCFNGFVSDLITVQTLLQGWNCVLCLVMVLEHLLSFTEKFGWMVPKKLIPSCFSFSMENIKLRVRLLWCSVPDAVGGCCWCGSTVMKQHPEDQMSSELTCVLLQASSVHCWQFSHAGRVSGRVVMQLY